MKITKENIEVIEVEEIMDYIASVEPEKQMMETIKLISSLLKVSKDVMEHKYKYLGWNKILDEFYMDSDVMRKYKLIVSVIAEKGICRSGDCKVFTPLGDVAESITGLQVYDLMSAERKYGKDSRDFRDFKERIEDLAITLTSIFQELIKDFSIINAIDINKDKAQVRSIQKIVAMGENNAGYRKEVGREVDKDYDADEAVLMADDPDYIKDHDTFEREKYFEALRKKRAGEKEKGEIKD